MQPTSLPQPDAGSSTRLPVGLDVRPLDPSTDTICAEWTFPAYHHLLDLQPATRFSEHGAPGAVRPLAWVASDAGRPVALAVACLPDEGTTDDAPRGELLSVHVEPEYRQQGLAHRLVAQLEDAVADAGYAAIETVYMTGSPSIPAVESLLRSRGWSTPEPRMLAMRATIDEAVSVPWFGRYRPRMGFDVVPWREVSEDEIAALRASDAADPWIAEDLRPWHYDLSYMEPVSSLGVRLDGQLVGWVINHPVGGDRLRVTCAFLRPDLSRRARILPVLTESLGRARDAGFRSVLFTVPIHHRQMASFTRRWCAPFVSFLGETRGCHKDLTATSSTSDTTSTPTSTKTSSGPVAA